MAATSSRHSGGGSSPVAPRPAAALVVARPRPRSPSPAPHRQFARACAPARRCLAALLLSAERARPTGAAARVARPSLARQRGGARALAGPTGAAAPARMADLESGM
ncbi:hypothetical protein BS78_07G143900 [Paspalum vaginatum]|nr:hypothetical protein BS78_07G143900 [Paspalum vaginatum]